MVLDSKGKPNHNDFSEILTSSSQKIREEGIKFRLVNNDDGEEVWDFLMEEFMPDEPVYRSMGILDASTAFRRFLINEVKKDILHKCIYSERACSVMAHNSEGEIVGLKLGFTTTHDYDRGYMFYYPFLEYFYWIIPEVVVNLNILGWYLEEQMRFHPNKAMKDLKAKSIFDGEILGVSRKARGLGLGKEMVKMSIAIAKKLGYEVYYTMVSGIFSQKIFRDLGFTLLNEIEYDEIKDRKGGLLLNDTREHKKAEFVYQKLWS